jgi:hypothetical protein
MAMRSAVWPHLGSSLIEREPDALDISAPHSRNQPFTSFLSRQVDNVAKVIPQDAEQPQARMLQVSPHDVILPARILVSQQNNFGSLISAQNLVNRKAPANVIFRRPQVSQKRGVGAAGRGQCVGEGRQAVRDKRTVGQFPFLVSAAG